MIKFSIIFLHGFANIQARYVVDKYAARWATANIWKQSHFSKGNHKRITFPISIYWRMICFMSTTRILLPCEVLFLLSSFYFFVLLSSFFITFFRFWWFQGEIFNDDYVCKIDVCGEHLITITTQQIPYQNERSMEFSIVLGMMVVNFIVWALCKIIRLRCGGTLDSSGIRSSTETSRIYTLHLSKCGSRTFIHVNR